jgi:hypothetical protein
MNESELNPDLDYNKKECLKKYGRFRAGVMRKEWKKNVKKLSLTQVVVVGPA